MQYRNPPEQRRPADPVDLDRDAAPGGVTARDGRAAGTTGTQPWWRPGAPTQFASDGPIDCWTDDPDDDIEVEVLPTAGT